MNSILEKMIQENVLSADLADQIKEAFEARVKQELESKNNELNEAYEEKVQELKALTEEYAEKISEEMTEKIDGYLNIVVENFIQSNKDKLISFVDAKRNEALSEGFKALLITGAVTLDEILEAEEDSKVEESSTMDSYEAKINDLADKISALNKENLELKKTISFNEATSDLTLVQQEKMKELCQNIDESANFETYNAQLDMIKNNVSMLGESIAVSPAVSSFMNKATDTKDNKVSQEINFSHLL